jgi:hypothetical protein
MEVGECVRLCELKKSGEQQRRTTHVRRMHDAAWCILEGLALLPSPMKSQKLSDPPRPERAIGFVTPPPPCQNARSREGPGTVQSTSLQSCPVYRHSRSGSAPPIGCILPCRDEPPNA